jgi:prephenate dehydrogenase
VLDRKHPRDQEQLCAGGFRDTTRIASGSPEMWRDIVLSNRENVLVAVKTLQKEIESLRLALESNDSTAVMDFLKGAKELRDAWPVTNVPLGNREG